jgi:hypothetical protein
MTAQAQLTIAHHWDGRPLDADETVCLLLRLRRTHLAIAVEAPFHGDPPPSGAPGPTARLWEHEVVELFIAGPDDGAGGVRYTEVELSPHGHHLVLQLAGVRRAAAERLPLRFRRFHRGGRWRGLALLDRELLPPRPWRAAAFALHGPATSRRFLASLPLPGAAPDFHQPARFPLLGLGEAPVAGGARGRR